MSAPADTVRDLSDPRRFVELLIAAEVLARPGDPGPLGPPVALWKRVGPSGRGKPKRIFLRER